MSRDPVVPRVRGLLYGGDYNPEQWPEEVWLDDARLMQEAGVNLVTLGVFSWALLEPKPGVFDFDWLDRVLDLLWSHGVAVDLATPTAAPTAWLVEAHPDMLPVTRDGVRLGFGSRRHYCPSSPHFREASVRIAEHLARRYSVHPALAMWHVGNEYGGHVEQCYCETSAAHFRAWLEARYGSIEALNHAWGTAFWSQRYGDFSQVEPPRRMPVGPNPTQALDWHRFSSDALLECYELEAAVLREQSPGIPLTTNFMFEFKACDYWRWSTREDVVSLDAYPDPNDPDAHLRTAVDYDLTRSETRGRPWILLENAPSAVQWREANLPKRPGLRRLWALHAVARGSDGALFFQWRASRAGAEKFHSGLLPHLGTRSRGWQETVRLGRDLQLLAEVAGTTSPRAKVAFLFDWENWWALDQPAHPSRMLDLREIVLEWYRPFFDANIPVDFVHPLACLDSYELVVVPNLYLASEAVVDRLTGFAEAGGTVAIGFFSLVVDENDHARCNEELHPVHRLLGVRVDEVWPLPHDMDATVTIGAETVGVRDWSEWLVLESALAIGSYASGPLTGRPAITRNDLGAGAVYYCSARLDASGFASLARFLAADAGVTPLIHTPENVEATCRTTRDSSYLFLLNHGDREVVVELGGRSGTDLLTGTPAGGRIKLEALGVAVLRLA